MSVRHPPPRLRRADLDAAVWTEALRQRSVKLPLVDIEVGRPLSPPLPVLSLASRLFV